MTRRHEALIPLTHDHHHALHNVRLLRHAAATDKEERFAAARSFVAFFREHSVHHFREEEEILFPRAIHQPHAPVDQISRVLVEHVRIHAMVDELERQVADGAVEPASMIELADLLKAHIRFEEDVLFPSIEKVVGSDLEGVALSASGRPAPQSGPS